MYQVLLDLSALAAGDQFELKLYEKIVSTGTQRLVETWTFSGAQSRPIFAAPSMILLHGWDMSLKRIAGSDRSIGWSIRQVA